MHTLIKCDRPTQYSNFFPKRGHSAQNQFGNECKASIQGPPEEVNNLNQLINKCRFLKSRSKPPNGLNYQNRTREKIEGRLNGNQIPITNPNTDPKPKGDPYPEGKTRR